VILSRELPVPEYQSYQTIRRVWTKNLALLKNRSGFRSNCDRQRRGLAHCNLCPVPPIMSQDRYHKSHDSGEPQINPVTKIAETH